MSATKIALSSMALDLRRVALGYNRGSHAMAERFLDEAISRKKEIDPLMVKPYISKLLNKVLRLKSEESDQNKAEDALLYSILFQNAAVKLP